MDLLKSKELLVFLLVKIQKTKILTILYLNYLYMKINNINNEIINLIALPYIMQIFLFYKKQRKKF